MKAYCNLMKHGVFACLLFIGVAGCGLGDYTSRIDEQRKRIQEFDEINNLLDDPIDIPSMKILGAKEETIPAWPFDVFLRLPRGFGTSAKDKDKKAYNDPFPCFRFACNDPNFNILIVAAQVAEKKEAEKFGVNLPGHFANYVKQALEDFNYRIYLEPNKLPWYFLPEGKVEKKIGVKKLNPLSGPLETNTFDEVVVYTDLGNKWLKDHSRFQAYFHRQPGRQICIVMHRIVEAPNEVLFNKMAEASLGTLDITPAAAARRAQFQLLRRR